MSDTPTIEFPCDEYPIKVIATTSTTLTSRVVEIVRIHDAQFKEDTVQEQPSSKGNYISVRLRIRATGEQQLKALHAELMAHPDVKLVL